MEMEFEVKSGAVRATDPCYDPETGCAATIKVKNGWWKGGVETEDVGAWGRRVSRLWAKHEDFNFQGPLKKVVAEDGGKFGVDSGQFGFFDIEVFEKHGGERDAGTSDEEGSFVGDAGFYSECCKATTKDDVGVVGEFGIVSCTGYGDGSYPVYATYDKDGQAVALVAVFIDDAKEEEDYD